MASDGDPGSKLLCYCCEVVIMEDNDNVADVGHPSCRETEGERGCYLEAGYLILSFQHRQAFFEVVLELLT